MKKCRIIAITGTRADYGIFMPVFQAIEQSPRLSLELIVTGMHLKSAYGNTAEDILNSTFSIVAEADTMEDEDSFAGMARFAGKTTVVCTDILTAHSPDIVLLLGDRPEMLAAATAAHYLRIPIAHLHGGEDSGSLDDAVRHAITMLATLHFASTTEHAAAIQRMLGKKAPYIHAVGAPGLDAIRTAVVPPRETLFDTMSFDHSLPLIIFLQHPDTADKRSAEEQIEPSIEALSKQECNVLIIGSNADAGGAMINRRLRKFASMHPRTGFRLSISHTEFLGWLKAANVLIGNSSSGIIEAASFGLPVINIGDRQKNRIRSGNVIDVGYNRTAIEAALEKALYDQSFHHALESVRNAYGDGHAAKRIAEILAVWQMTDVR